MTDHSSDRPSRAECVACGARIETTEWHPATTTVDLHGHMAVVSFCSQECYTAWRTNASTGATVGSENAE